MDRTSLGDRMKGYEEAIGSVLIGRMPAIVRVDGKAFHTFVKRINTSNDPSSGTGPSQLMHNVMMNTALVMANQIQNCVLAYTQSDEISFLLRDYDKLNSQQWFGGKVVKIATTTAAMASAYFNFFWAKMFPNDIPQVAAQLPLFDSRVYNMPKDDVTNYFVWRQKDATRNSINFIARCFLSHKQMQGKNTSEVMDLLMAEHQVNWNDYDTWKKRGACIVQGTDFPFEGFDEIPIFTADRNYIEQFVYPEETET